MNEKYKKILTIILAFLTISLGFGISYAMHSSKPRQSQSSSIVVSDEFISINYLDGKTFDVNDFKNGDTLTKKISVTNIGNVNTYLTISLMDVSKSSEDLNVTVLDSDKNVIYDKKLSNIDTELVKANDLEIGKTLSYTIMIRNNGADARDFYANILAYKEVVKQSSKNFKETILENTEVREAKTQVGKELATEDEGLIKTSDDDGEAYYFRGNVENNNVDFAGFRWRIVRINGNSSVRLILDATLDDQLVYNDNADEVEDYTTKLIFNNSNIKKNLESWINSDLSEYSKYIIDSIFCEDVSVFNEENDVVYLNAYNRIFTDEIPTLTCMGNKITAKVGLLTADEVEFAGAYQKNSNSNYYLYNNNIANPWWTLSGSQILEKNHVVDAISVISVLIEMVV